MNTNEQLGNVLAELILLKDKLIKYKTALEMMRDTPFAPGEEKMGLDYCKSIATRTLKDAP